MWLYLASLVIGALWYLIGKTVVCLILANFNIKELRDEWEAFGLIEQWLAFIWPATIIMFFIEWVKTKVENQN